MVIIIALVGAIAGMFVAAALLASGQWIAGLALAAAMVVMVGKLGKEKK